MYKGAAYTLDDLVCTKVIESYLKGQFSRTKCRSKGAEKYQTGTGNIATDTMPMITGSVDGLCTGSSIIVLDGVLLSKLTSTPTTVITDDVDCVKAEDARATADTFAGAVINISNEYHDTNGDEEAKCIAAYKEALASLQAAYAYQGGTRTVLFKPTLTSAPYTFRNEKAAALSYFIGTKCLIFAAKSPGVAGNWVFPPGNEDGTIFQEDGFGLGLSNDNQGIPRGGWKAFTKKGPYDVLSGGENCETALLWDKFVGARTIQRQLGRASTRPSALSIIPTLTDFLPSLPATILPPLLPTIP